jgi:hypothetical protein
MTNSAPVKHEAIAKIDWQDLDWINKGSVANRERRTVCCEA